MAPPPPPPPSQTPSFRERAQASLSEINMETCFRKQEEADKKPTCRVQDFLFAPMKEYKAQLSEEQCPPDKQWEIQQTWIDRAIQWQQDLLKTVEKTEEVKEQLPKYLFGHDQNLKELQTYQQRILKKLETLKQMKDKKTHLARVFSNC